MPETYKKTAGSPWQRLANNVQFRWLFAGNTTLFLAYSATILLRSLLAWELTGDEMALAWINLATAICMFTMSIFSGAVIDRLERRRLMMLAQSFIFAAEGAVLVLFVTGHLTFGFLMASAIAASVSFPFIMPARTAMLVETVGRMSLGKATALISAGINVARMVSPAVIGVLSDMVGIRYGYVFLLVLHVTSLLCTLRLKRSYPEDTGGGAFFYDIKEGFVYLFQNKSLALCIVFGLLPILIVIPLQNLLVVFVDELWQRGGSGLGIMMGAMGVGGLMGSFLMAMVPEGKLVRPMIASSLALGVFLVVFSHSPSFWLAVVVLFCVYSSSVLTQTLVNTSVQLMAADRFRGRITTITLMSFGLAPVGTIPLAFATKQIGADWALTSSAVLLILAVVVFWFMVPAFRHIDHKADPRR